MVHFKPWKQTSAVHDRLVPLHNPYLFETSTLIPCCNMDLIVQYNIFRKKKETFLLAVLEEASLAYCSCKSQKVRKTNTYSRTPSVFPVWWNAPLALEKKSVRGELFSFESVEDEQWVWLKSADQKAKTLPSLVLAFPEVFW